MKYLLGIGSVILSEATFALNPVLLKSNEAPFVYKALFSNITLTIPSLIYILQEGYSDIDKKNKKIEELNVLLFNLNTFIASISYFLYTILFYYCQQTLPVSISLPTLMLYPFILLICSRIVNKESINIGEILGGFVTFLGIIILSSSPLKEKPPNYIFKIVLSILAAFFCAISYLFLKTSEDRIIVKEESLKIDKLKKNKDELYNIHANMLLLNTIPSILFISMIVIKHFIFKNEYNHSMIFKGDTSVNSLGILFVCSFILQYVCNILLQYGYINLDSVTYSALLNTSILVSFIYGRIFFKETINVQKIIGCLIILSGISFNIYSSTQIKNSKHYLFIKR